MSDDELAQGINELVPNIDSVVSAVRRHAASAINLAIEAGFYLLETHRRFVIIGAQGCTDRNLDLRFTIVRARKSGTPSRNSHRVFRHVKPQ